MDESSEFRYCTLIYRPSEKPSPVERPVLLLLERPSGIRILVDPEWQLMILPQDRDFIQEILADFGRRTDTDAVFKQLSQLNWGPLVTQEIGIWSVGNDRLLDLVNRFVPV